jgi:capsular polysaccharide biosynthesis protein
MLGNLPPTDVEYPQKVFISRRDAYDRRIANFEAVVETLEALGFREYSLDQMPFREQVRLFAGADVIVSPHGAGLTHLLFAENASVIELFPANDVHHTYFCIASQLGFDYDFLLCEPHRANIQVDDDTLEALVKSVLSRRNS